MKFTPRFFPKKILVFTSPKINYKDDMSKKRIENIFDEAGREWSNEIEIQAAFLNYYKKLFLSGGGSDGDMDICLEGLEGRVSSDMNGRLLAAFTAEEVEFALGQMHPLKSPGPDRFAAGFYHNSWSTVGSEVCEAVLNFLNLGILDPAINHTFIALIPKKMTPSCVIDFRLISLCNVVYKLCAKVLANQLKVVLPQIISPTQSAFIPGRLITDNLLVAFEALHTMNG